MSRIARNYSAMPWRRKLMPAALLLAFLPVSTALATHHYCTTCSLGCSEGPNKPGGGGTWDTVDTYASGLKVETQVTWFPHNECRGLGGGCDDHGTSKCTSTTQRIARVGYGWGSWSSPDVLSTNIC